MNIRLMMIASALLASLICIPASAQTGAGPEATGNAMNGPGQSAGPGTGQGVRDGARHARAPRDCKQAQDTAACAARRDTRAALHEACRERVGPQRHQCMQEQMQNFDCAKAGDPQRCETRKLAYKECQGQTGPALHQCMKEKMPPVDCSKSPNQSRCERHQKAYAACKNKIGHERKACMREQTNVK